MLNAIMCTFLRKTRTEPGENILTNRQTEKASKQDKQTITSTSKGTGARRGEGGMLTISRSKGSIHQLVLVVLVSKGGKCIFRGLFCFCFFVLHRAKLQAVSLRGEEKDGYITLNQDLRMS